MLPGSYRTIAGTEPGYFRRPVGDAALERPGMASARRTCRRVADGAN